MEIKKKTNFREDFTIFVVIALMVIISLNSASAQIETLGTSQQNTDINLIQTCSNCTFVNITTIRLANGTIATFNEAMTKDGTFYNWTLDSNYTSSLGEYIVNDVRDVDGVNTAWTYTLQVTSTGDTFSTAGAIVLWLAVTLFMVFGLFLFIGFTNKENKPPIRMTYLLGSYIGFLAAVNFISIFIGSASTNQAVVGFFDSFTAIMFIIFWFAFGMFAIMWGVTFFQTMVWKKNIRKLERYG